MNFTAPLSSSSTGADKPTRQVAGVAAKSARAKRDKLAPSRLGFLGVGWIGRHRLEAIAKSGAGEVVAICDPCRELALQAQALAPASRVVPTLEELLQHDLDGVVIATPSALHAEQALAVLSRGMAVFCQKPLGRSAAEAQRVIEAAARADRLLGVDLSYRFLTGTEKIRNLCRSGELGRVYAVDLVFHNAYGPDKPWFYQRRLSGGGCLMDLGTHLVDLALWCMDFPEVCRASGTLMSDGVPLPPAASAVEDYAVAELHLANSTVVRLACSWKLPAGREAIITGSFYGTQGGAGFSNVGGSFYDFRADRYLGTKSVLLAEGPEPWGGRAAIDWAWRLHSGSCFDPEVARVVDVARALDLIYDSATADASEPERAKVPRRAA